MKRITNITKRDIIDTLTNGLNVSQLSFDVLEIKPYHFSGRCSDVEFLSRLYDLGSLPSLDSRCSNAAEEIARHTYFNDYPINWVFDDDRFGLKVGDDEQYLRFVCEIFHPEVRNEYWEIFFSPINDLLRKDGYELYPTMQISEHDVYGWRDLRVIRQRCLKQQQIDVFLDLFNRGGYVLDFTDKSFAEFTKKSIDIDLQNRYKLSKGKSLKQFVIDAKDSDMIKLFSDLLDYYESSKTCLDDKNHEPQQIVRYQKCKEILATMPSFSSIIQWQEESLKNIFSSDYLTKMISIMFQYRETNPTEAIGKSKELIESCCKTILEYWGEKVDIKLENLGQLVKRTQKTLQTGLDVLPDNLPQMNNIKILFSSLGNIVNAVAELRNSYGSGHGKSISYKGLLPRHADLAIGSSVTLVRYLWDMHMQLMRNTTSHPNEH